jgi:hypothetical protein
MIDRKCTWTATQQDQQHRRPPDMGGPGQRIDENFNDRVKPSRMNAAGLVSKPSTSRTGVEISTDVAKYAAITGRKRCDFVQMASRRPEMTRQ